MATPPEQALQRTHACALTLSMPFLAVNLLDGFTKAALATSPALFWTYDVTKWVLLPAVTLFAMRLWCGARAADFGLHGPAPRWSPAQLSGLCALFTALAMSYFAFRSLAAAFLRRQPQLRAGGAVAGGGRASAGGAVPVRDRRGGRGAVLPGRAAGDHGTAGDRRGTGDRLRAGLFHPVRAVALREQRGRSRSPPGSYGVVAAVFALRVRNLWPLIAGHFATDFVAFY